MFEYDLQDFCLDLFEPSGHGKRRKRNVNEEIDGTFLPKIERLIKSYNDSTPFTKFKENIEYTVMMPDGMKRLILYIRITLYDMKEINDTLTFFALQSM